MMSETMYSDAQYYLGDPCYVVEDSQWNEFCDRLTAAYIEQGEERVANPTYMKWKGVELEIWSNGGDGCWEFFHRDTGNIGNRSSFSVDAGIFTVMPIDILDKTEGIESLGMLYHREPWLQVSDGYVFINGEPDDMAHSCDECGDYSSQHEIAHCECCGYTYGMCCWEDGKDDFTCGKCTEDEEE